MTPAEFKQARQMLGLSQAELAAVMGYGAQTRISEIESRSIVPEQAARLMQAYIAGYRPADWPS
jgi:transcriptional regulator with XRE-family HTH domain